MPDKINLGQPLADFLNMGIASRQQIVVIQLDGNSITGTPPALLIAATGHQAVKLQEILNQIGVKDSPSGIVQVKF